jgi:hypothetical protein
LVITSPSLHVTNDVFPLTSQVRPLWYKEKQYGASK